MKYLMKFENFQSDDFDIVNDRTMESIEDIFEVLKDHGLIVDDIYKGTSLSMGTHDVITDHIHFGQEIGKDGKFKGSFKSFTIRLTPKKEGSIVRKDLQITDEMFEELKSGIAHVESEMNIRLSSVYLRTLQSVWFKNIDIMKNYLQDKFNSNDESSDVLIKRSEFASENEFTLRYVNHIDLTFEILD